MRRKLFFFGIDSATWDLIEPWVRQGQLPGFKLLMDKGSCFRLTSTTPPITPVAWPTALTGTSPAQHGFYDFYKLDENKEITINLASDLPYSFFWDFLSKDKKKVGIFNLPVTYPLGKVNGIMISGLMTPGLASDFIVPSELKSEFLRRFPHFRFAPEIKVSRADPQSYRLRLKENIEDAKETVKIAKWLFAKDDWDFFAMNFMAVDHVQHFFWEFMRDPQSPYQEAILSVYKIVDQYLLEMLNKHGQKYQFMVFSDHGAGPLEKTLFLNRWLLKKGYLQFKQTPLVLFKRLLSNIGFDPQTLIGIASKLKLVRHSGRLEMQKRNRFVNKLVLSYADLDWAKTQAYSFGMYGGIYLSKRNQKLMQTIIRDFRKDFGRDVTFVKPSSEIYQTTNYPQTIPDIQFLLKEGAIVSTNIYAFAGQKLLTDPITNKSGEHRMQGVLAFYPKIKAINKAPRLLDITPTILSFFKIKVPSYCWGRSLFKQTHKYFEVDDIQV